MTTHRERMKLSRLGMVVLLAGAMAAAVPQVFAQAGVNLKLQAKVASKLSQDKLLQGQNIMVNASGSQVTLSGTVQTPKQWQEAESVTANVGGVRTILNNLTIAEQSQGTPSQSYGNQNYGNQGYGPNDQMAPPPPPDAQTAPAPPAPASPGYQMNDAGNPPPPPPDQEASQSGQTGQGGQNYGQQARPEYQGGARGESYGAGYGSQNYQGYNGQGYNQNQYNNREQYPPQQASGPVSVPAGTLLQVRTVEPLDSAHLQPGQRFDATVARDVWEGNVLAIPRGATVEGVVVNAEQPEGKLGGKPHMALRLTSLNLSGQIYRLNTNVWSGRGPDKAGYTAGNTITGGVLGAIVGGIIGRGAGAAVGAGLGAMTGLGVSSATKGPHIYIPSEAVLNFHLAEPVTVQPVSWQEARRLASNVPELRTRPMYRRRYVRPYPYGYAYPPPYYYAPYPYYGPMYYSFGMGW
ncbi:MAG: BON domain-containing protein [Acidobacteriaceae bacterium]